MMDRLQRARDAYACASTALPCIVDGGRCCFPRSAAFSDNAAPTLPPAWICQPDSTDGVAYRFSWRTFCEESIR
ncbi:hypothetical protein OBG92_04456 [Pseudomonas paraeruginosa]|nr:hypothetical protein OBG92_04456 [Pseudomonas aeruginosa]